MPRVLFVTPRFHPYPGGYENYVAWLAKSLWKTGARVSVFTTTAFDLESFWLRGRRTLPPGQEFWEGIEVRRFEICYRRWLRHAGRLLALLPNWRLKAAFGRPGFRIMDLAAALSRTTANVIHVGPLPYNQLMYYGLRAARRRGARILCTPCTHFGEEASHEVARHYTQPFQTQLLNHCDTVLALTELERKRLVELGVSPDRVVTTGAGIDVENAVGGAAEACRRELGLGDSPIVLHFGMKAFEKGSVSVVEAMKILWANGSQARLVMAGPGMQALKDYLQAQTGNLGRFLDLPPVNDRQKRDLMAAATVFVQPSRVESFGLIYVEAWANAKPLIAADTGVSRELIEDGVDGLLVPFGNAARIADAINCLLESSDLRQRMAEAGRRKVLARYTWEAAIARIRPYFSANAPGPASQD